MTDEPDTLTQALQYASRGWRCFPVWGAGPEGGCACPLGTECPNAAKHPWTKHGLKDATTVDKALRQWWAFRPESNIGIATGPGFGWVLDVDPRHGGRTSLETLMASHGVLPRTLRQQTGGGGRQAVFQWPEGGGIRNSAGALGPGLDVRGDGGYVVFAPSHHASGGVYRVLEDVPPAPAPEWLLELARRANGHKNGHAFQSHTEGRGTVYGEGTRNDRLIRVAGALRAVGTHEDAVLSALLVENERACVPPLDEQEVRDVWTSSKRYGANPPPLVWVKRVYVTEPPSTNGTSHAPEPPAGVWSGWIGRYRDLMAPTTEAPDAFHLAGALIAASMVLGRHCWTWNGRRLYPNLFVVLIGSSGKSRKDTAMDRAISVMEHPNVMQMPVCEVLDTIQSAEGLVEHLAKSPVLVRLAEMSDLLKNAKRESTGNIVPKLTGWYDCPPRITLPTRTNSVEAKNPFLGILGASTEEWFNPEVPESWIRGGFLGRFLFFTGDGKGPIANPPPPEPQGLLRLQDHLFGIRSDLAERGRLAVHGGREMEIPLSVEAQAWAHEWYLREYQQVRSEEMATLLRRHDAMIRKVGMLYAALDGRVQIEAEDLAIGAQVVGLSVAYMESAAPHWGESEDRRLQDKILAFVHSHKCGAEKRIVQRALSGRVSARSFRDALGGLLSYDALRLNGNRLECLHEPKSVDAKDER